MFDGARVATVEISCFLSIPVLPRAGLTSGWLAVSFDPYNWTGLIVVAYIKKSNNAP
jgi:hypothetical protein